MNIPASLIQEVSNCLDYFRQAQFESLKDDLLDADTICKISAGALSAGCDQAMEFALDYLSRIIYGMRLLFCCCSLPKPRNRTPVSRLRQRLRYRACHVFPALPSNGLPAP